MPFGKCGANSTFISRNLVTVLNTSTGSSSGAPLLFDGVIPTGIRTAALSTGEVAERFAGGSEEEVLEANEEETRNESKLLLSLYHYLLCFSLWHPCSMSFQCIIDDMFMPKNETRVDRIRPRKPFTKK